MELPDWSFQDKLNRGNISITKQDFVDPFALLARENGQRNRMSSNCSKLRIENTLGDEKGEKQSYYITCITNNNHLFDTRSLEEDQINKFYKGTQLASRRSGFVEDRFDIDPVAWGQLGQGQAYPGFGASVDTPAFPIGHLLPISIATSNKNRRSSSAKDAFRASVNETHSAFPTQRFLSTYNHDYWPKPEVAAEGQQEIFPGKSLGGYSKPNLFRLGTDWNWKWIPSCIDSGSMHIGGPHLHSHGGSVEADLEEGVSHVSGWDKVLHSNRTWRFNPYDRTDGPIEPTKHNPFPILMSGHNRMLHKNILRDNESKDGSRTNF